MPTEFRYSVFLQWSQEDEGFVATIPELPGVSAVANTPDEAIQDIQIVASICIESMKDCEEYIPKPNILKFDNAN